MKYSILMIASILCASCAHRQPAKTAESQSAEAERTPAAVVSEVKIRTAEGRCLEAPTLSQSGFPLRTRTLEPAFAGACHPENPNQIWKRESYADGTFVIKPNGEALCIDKGPSRQEGGPVVLFPCNGQESQRWTLGGDDAHKLSSYQTGGCADLRAEGSVSMRACAAAAPIVFDSVVR